MHTLILNIMYTISICIIYGHIILYRYLTRNLNKVRQIRLNTNMINENN